jgi:hypothetical protein
MLPVHPNTERPMVERREPLCQRTSCIIARVCGIVFGTGIILAPLRSEYPITTALASVTIVTLSASLLYCTSVIRDLEEKMANHK